MSMYMLLDVEERDRVGDLLRHDTVKMHIVVNM
jgi:hypothetical protein